MKKTFSSIIVLVTVLLFIITIDVNAQVNKLSKEEKKDGWQSLFDGKSKKGWHIYLNTSDGSSWKVSDGELYLDASHPRQWDTPGGGDLVTDGEFENYHLSMEWKISDSGNSGIIFGVKEDPKYERTYHTGMEMQVLDDNGHPDRAYISHRAGCLYDLIPVTQSTVKPAGQWNKAEIIYNKGSLKLFLNGVNVVSTTVGDENWKKMLAASKFKQWPDFSTFRNGRIALQDHGNTVWYRNIKIKKLS